MESMNGPKPHPRGECHSSGQVLQVCVPVPFVPVGSQKQLGGECVSRTPVGCRFNENDLNPFLTLN